MSIRTVRDCDRCGVRDLGSRKSIAIGTANIDVCAECASEILYMVGSAIDPEMQAGVLKSCRECLEKTSREYNPC